MQPNKQTSSPLCAQARLDVRVGLGEAEVVVLLRARPLLAGVVRPLGVVGPDGLPRLDRFPSLIKRERKSVSHYTG